MKLMKHLETEIYPTKTGHIALKQSDDFGHDDSIVVLAPDQIPVVIAYFNELMANKDEWAIDPRADEEEAEPDHPPTPEPRAQNKATPPDSAQATLALPAV